jgi:hypothetical protein
MSLQSATNASGGSDGNAVISDTALASQSTSSGGRHGVHRVKRVFPGMKRPLGPPGVITGRAPKSEESRHSRSPDDGDDNSSTRNPSNAPRAPPLISTAVLRSSESNYSMNNPASSRPPLPLKPSTLRASKSQHFATASRKSDESFPSSGPSDPSLAEHAKAGRHPEMAFQFPRPSTKSVSSPSPLSTFLRPSTPLALRSRFEREQGDAPLDSVQFISIGPQQEHYEQDSSSPLAPISELSNTSRSGPSQRRSISLTNVNETFKFSKPSGEGSVPSCDGTKFPALGSSETSLSRHGVSLCTPIEDVSSPKGRQKGRISATGSSSSALTTPRLLRVNPASLAHRRFDSTPIRDRAASASSIPVVRSRQSISVNLGATPEHSPRQVHHHHNLSALGAAGGIARDLGRKGWDRVERLWSSTNNSSPPRFGAPLHDGSREGRDAKPKSHSSDASLPIGHIDGGSSSSTDYGVCLPICLRPSSSNSGGLLFGRSPSDAVAATKITTSEAPWLDEKGRLRGTNCPALVVRCIQHLELWGVQEEGIFRCVIYVLT